MYLGAQTKYILIVYVYIYIYIYYYIYVYIYILYIIYTLHTTQSHPVHTKLLWIFKYTVTHTLPLSLT